jgi:hypothetical protein
MIRSVIALLPLIAPGAAASAARADTPWYELMINGESFTIQTNRLVRLQSKNNPDVRYDVALRVAPTQRLKLNSVQFDYDWLSKVQDDGKPGQRTVRLTHELGFTMLITDFARPLAPETLDEALKILIESASGTFLDLKAADLDVGPPRERKFTGVAGRGAVIRYRDAEDLAHTCLVYVLNGPEFTVSCIVQYVDKNLDDVKPLLKKTLDSFRPAR